LAFWNPVMAKRNGDHQDERYEHCRKVKRGYDRIVEKLSARLRVTPRDEDGFPTHPDRLAKKEGEQDETMRNSQRARNFPE
jgi:hypothetical protein